MCVYCSAVVTLLTMIFITIGVWILDCQAIYFISTVMVLWLLCTLVTDPEGRCHGYQLISIYNVLDSLFIRNTIVFDVLLNWLPLNWCVAQLLPLLVCVLSCCGHIVDDDMHHYW